MVKPERFVLRFLLYCWWTSIIVRCYRVSKYGFSYSEGSKMFADSLAGSADMCERIAGGKGFRCINRRALLSCSHGYPDLEMSLSTQGPLADEENVTVTVSGMRDASPLHWVALISPSTAHVSYCPWNSIKYQLTGDLKSHPLLCHYPVKAQFLNNDPSYASCSTSTCSGSITFNVINIRTDIEFVLFTGGFDVPCILKRSQALSFSNPAMPLYPRLSAVDSTSTAMKVSWISADNGAQYVQYGGLKEAESIVSTFTQEDMCDWKVGSAAKDFGWHDPGYIHTAVMTQLLPSQNYLYKYGSDKVGWSQPVQFRTPPAAGSPELKIVAFGDMGQAPLDPSDEHYMQPGSRSVITGITEEVAKANVDSVFHIGDLSYATGFLVTWDYFLKMITPVASRVPYMTAIGNHERDFPKSGAHYDTTDSGGECGVPYEKYFPMPTPAKDKPWYSISQGPVHFTVISSEHAWDEDSEQYEWMIKDLAAVNRTETPWLIFTGHRPMYSTADTGLTKYIRLGVDPAFVITVEPILLQFQVDLALWGHVHNYERTCSVFMEMCNAFPAKDAQGIDTFDNTKYSAPVHAIIGAGGFSLDKFKDKTPSWSMVRKSEYGYSRIHATPEQILFEFVNAETRQVDDTFNIVRSPST